MTEIWRDIKDYEGFYQVSNLGRIKSLDRVVINVNGKKSLYKGKVLSIHYDKNGYVKVCLNKNNKRRKFSVHRLVAEAFIPNPNNYPEVNHIDEVKTNNKVSNLEWCTSEYNKSYGTRAERSYQTNLKNNSYNKNLEKARESNKAKGYEKQKEVIRNVHNSEKANKRKVICLTTNEIFDSMWEAERKYGIYPNSISKCCKGTRKACGQLPNGTKLEWEYLD